MKGNKNKRTYDVELLSALGNADEKFIDQAFLTDTKEKFQRLNGSVRKKIYLKVTALAASLLLVCGFFMFLPHLLPSKDENASGEAEFYEEKKTKNENETGGYHPIEGRVVITSGDMWNYYAAIKAVYFSDKNTASSKSILTLSGSNVSDTDKRPRESESPNPPPQITESGYGVTESGETSSPNNGEGIYYYDLSDFGKLNITRATYLRAELKEKNGFLASKIGTGEIEIVITEINGFDSMITFKNGDKFFSCLENGLNDFSSHKYIEGFFVVKNEDAENSSFYLTVSKSGEITEIDCSIRNSKYYVSDVMEVIKATQKSAYVDEGYSIKELEDFFNGREVKE